MFLHEVLAGGEVVKNFGFSFSLSIPYLLVISAVFLLFLLKEYKNRYVFLVLVGGGVNFLDRIRFGYVRDYWFVPGLMVYNNLPDWIIFVGIIGLCVLFLKTKKS